MIPFNYPKAVYLKYDKEIKTSINKVLNGGNYIKSRELHKFEKSFSNYFNTKIAIGVGNATDSIYIALKTLGISRGDEVITVSHTATGTIMGIMNTGATPVFCDVSENDYNLDLNLLPKKITKKTKAIVIVHLYGQSCNMDKLMNISKKKGIPIIEDCSQAAGSKFKNKYLGSIGMFGCYSFFPTKNLSCIGDGGMITTNKKSFENKILCLREYGWDKNRNANLIGINSRLDEIQAAILNVKLKYLHRDNQERRYIAKFYNNEINNSKVIKPLENLDSEHVYHLYVIRVSKRKKLIELLNKNKIYPGIHYAKAVHQQKLFKFKKYCLPVTEKIVNSVLSLPIYPGIKKNNLKKIVNIINDF